jgi:hypothetical protein
MSDLNPYEEGLAVDLAKAQARIEELCVLHREYEKILTERIEELEANLGKTTKLLEQIERRLSGISGFFFDTFPRKEIRSLLEELKVQDDQ